jgi:hypothetical protein
MRGWVSFLRCPVGQDEREGETLRVRSEAAPDRAQQLSAQRYRRLVVGLGSEVRILSEMGLASCPVGKA